ncbi:MAG: hypothetical protein ACLVIU_08960 [Paraclostridium sp.]
MKDKDLCTTSLKYLMINLKNYDNFNDDKVKLKTSVENLLKDISKNEDI